jgi:hypothetical protein
MPPPSLRVAESELSDRIHTPVPPLGGTLSSPPTPFITYGAITSPGTPIESDPAAARKKIGFFAGLAVGIIAGAAATALALLHFLQ